MFLIVLIIIMVMVMVDVWVFFLVNKLLSFNISLYEKFEWFLVFMLLNKVECIIELIKFEFYCGCFFL